MSCVGLDPKNLEFCSGNTVLPGIRSKCYFIPKRDIVTWPTLPSAITTAMANIAKYTGDFTLATDKTWKEIDIIVDKSPVTFESQGEKPSKTFLNKATLMHASIGDDAAGFCRLANNDDFVYLIQTKEGKYRVIGNDMYQTDTKPKQELGDAATSAAGTTIEVSVTDIVPAPFYEGAIATEDGDVAVVG